MKKKKTDHAQSEPCVSGQDSEVCYQDMESLRSAYDRLSGELRESRALHEATTQRYASILDFAPVGYCMVSSEGAILRANLTLASMLQTERAALEGRALKSLLTPDARTDFVSFCERVCHSGGREWCESVFRKPDGSLLEARIDAVLMYDLEWKADIIHATIVDLSGQKRMERELLEVQKIGGIASFRWNFVSGVLAWSPEFYVMVGRSAHDVPETIGGCLSLVHPDDRDLVMNVVNGAMAGEDVPLVECRIVMPDESLKWFAVQGRVQFDAGNKKATGMIGYAQDITDRTIGESERQRLQSQLLQSQKMEAIGHLAAGVAYDFNNILQTIIGYAQVLQKHADSDPTITKSLDGILFSVARASDLTRGLLAFGSKQTMSFMPIDLNDLVRDASRLLARILGEEIELTMLLSSVHLTTMADSTQLQQAMVALCTHARDSMPGGGRLFISTNLVDLNGKDSDGHSPKISGNYALLSISDSGPGFAERERARIFEPFAGARQKGGAGIGLAAVYGVIKQHGGFIDVASEIGSGTTFRMYLPLAPAEACRPGLVKPIVHRGQGTILLAEDDPLVRQTMKDNIEMLGYQVLLAASGQEAVALFGQHHSSVDLVILDIVMPHMNGKETSEHIRRIKPSARVLFMSGYTADALNLRNLLDDGTNFIVKPIALSLLSERIGHFLGGRNAGGGGSVNKEGKAGKGTA